MGAISWISLFIGIMITHSYSLMWTGILTKAIVHGHFIYLDCLGQDVWNLDSKQSQNQFL